MRPSPSTARGRAEPGRFRGPVGGGYPCTTARGCASPTCNFRMWCCGITWTARRGARRCCGPMVRASCSRHRSHKTWPPTTHTPGRCAQRTAIRGTIPATRWRNCWPTTMTARAPMWHATTRRGGSSSCGRCTTARGCDWDWRTWAIGRPTATGRWSMTCCWAPSGEIGWRQRIYTALGRCNNRGRAPTARTAGRAVVAPRFAAAHRGAHPGGAGHRAGGAERGVSALSQDHPAPGGTIEQAGDAGAAGHHVLGAPRPVDLSRLLSPGGGKRVAERVLRHGAGARLARGDVLQRHALGDGALLEPL